MKEKASADPGLRAFQAKIEEIYGARDRARGVPGTFMWFVEEVGELARTFTNEARGGPPDEAARRAEEREFADCLAWLATLASLRGIDLAGAAWAKYANGCPRCSASPCRCEHRE